MPFPSRTDTAGVADELEAGALIDRFGFDDSATLAWDSFADPVLTELIAEGLRSNLPLEQQRLSVEATRINLEAARTRLFPLFTLTGPNASVSRSRDASTVQTYAFSGTASYEVDLWREVGNDVERQMLAVTNSEDGLQSARISIAAQVARFYFSIRQQDEAIRLQQEQLGILGEQRRLTEVNFRAGTITRQPLDQLDVRIETLRSNIERARIVRQSTLQSLAAVLGKPVQQFSLPALAFVETRIPRLDPAAPAELLRNRPDLRIAERAIRSANLSVENARAAWLPRLTASASGSSSSGSLSDLLSGDSLASNIGASLGTLLFDNGFRDRSIRQSELFREQAILAYENSIIRALSDIENALNDQYENTLQIEIQQRQAAAQARVTETTRILYQTGDATAFDLIREQQNLLQVQQRRVNNWRDGMFASISILQALGVDPLESITP
ncbi:MAG: TolC family protein [Pseudomonadota bacterium]